MQNALKDEILQATTENIHINVVTLQKLQCTAVVAIDQPEAAQNGQKNVLKL